MFIKREIPVILLAGIVIGYVYSFTLFSWNSWLLFSLMGILIVFAHSLGQKIAALRLDSSTEISLWKMQRFWFGEARKLPFAFPSGLLFPIIFAFATFGWLRFTAITTFEASALPRIRPFSKVTEKQLGVIALSGSIANVVLAFISFLLNYPQFAMMNLYFAFFSLLPISSLDGVKIFFGSRLLWIFSFVFVISLIILFEVAGFWATLISALMIALAIVIAYYASFENF